MVVTKQLLNTVPEDVCVWVRQRKPKRGEEAGQPAEDYLKAHRCEGSSGEASR